MQREQTLEEIYDGRFYTPDDPVAVGCGDCAGCSECCRNTGDTIILDPYDMYMLCRATGRTFTDMIEQEIEIRLVDGLILPNLMQHHDTETEDETDPSDDHCPFLSGAGRCTIHPYRPGFCRLYPMGRYYTEDGFRYILQKDECTGREKTPVLLRDWLGIEDLESYEEYVLDWHSFRKKAEQAVTYLSERSRDSVTRYILQVFFVHPYLTDIDFYTQYEARMETCRNALRQIL
ncbi:MAG: YkgJ family cysteine cluster protein [Eubacterium sp.]|nr:YkgJ family cysteine cluster protein [Eubacterium sp.]